MNASAILFYIISAFILAAALLAVTTRIIFRSAIFLLFTLIGTAALFFWMGIEFIAAVQVIIYVGGIVVLIIFSIFLTQKSGDEMPKPLKNRSVFSALALVFGFAFTYHLINGYGFGQTVHESFNVKVSEIGMQMLSTKEHGFVLPFEVVSILLLASMVGCIVIAMKIKPMEESDNK
jgi:NADH-quinone oxidoreductase subunit J